MVVFVVFMLLQREDLRDRLIRLTAGGQLTVATQALDDASTRISRYLVAQAMVNGTYGIAIALGLWIIGLTVGRSDSAGTTDLSQRHPLGPALCTAAFHSLHRAVDRVGVSAADRAGGLQEL